MSVIVTFLTRYGTLLIETSNNLRSEGYDVCDRYVLDMLRNVVD
jgi:hypothetical protein